MESYSQASRLAVAALVLLLSQTCWAQYGVVAGGGPFNRAAATTVAISNPYGVAVDASGNLYFSVSGQNRVYEVSLSGLITVLAGTGAPGFSGDGGPAAGAQLNSPFGVAVDSAGNVYISDTNNERIRKVSSGGTITTVAGTGSYGYFGDGGLATNAQFANPEGIALDAAGNIYVADTYNQRIREITAAGVITTVAGNGMSGYSGDNVPATSTALAYPSGIAVDGLGNLYIADSSNYRVRKVTGGFIITAAGNGTYGSSGDGGPATNAELASLQGVAVDQAGNLYVADTGDSKVREVTVGGFIFTAAGGNGGCVQQTGPVGDGCPPTSADLNSPYALAVDGSGNLFIADTFNHRVRKVSGGLINTVAGNGSVDYSGDFGAATNAQTNVGGIALDNAGNIYIADSQDYRIREVTGGVITTAAGNGSNGYSGDNGLASSAQIGYVGSIATDPQGNLYLADSNSSRIRKVSAGIITTFAGNGTSGYSGDGGLATSAAISPQFVATDPFGNVFMADSNSRVRKISAGTISLFAGGGPANGSPATSVSVAQTDVAVDSAGNVYVVSPSEHRVFVIGPGGTISTVAGNGTPGYSGDGGLAASAQLNYPQAIAVDGNNPANLYIADANNSRVRKVSGGIITTFAGGGPNCVGATDFAGDGCPAISANLSFPSGLAVDVAGNVFIADAGSDRIRKVASATGAITTIAGTGVYGYSGDGGLAVNAELRSPMGVAVDNAGNIYIADSANYRVREVLGSGVITTVAGNGTYGFSGDGGAAMSAELTNVEGVAVNGAGTSLYIADRDNARIRKVTGGVISTVAGDGLSGYSGDGGAATSAELSEPEGVAVDNLGNFYIADNGNDRTRKVTAGSFLISTIAGNGFYLYSGDGGPAVNAQLGTLDGLAADNRGNVYISDSTNGRVRVVSPSGTITTFAGGGTQFVDGGAPTNTYLNAGPLATDSSGNLYIAGSGLIREVSGGVINTVATFAGNGSFFFSGGGGIAVDVSGNVYASDTSANLVYRFSTPGTPWVNSLPATVGIKFRTSVSGLVTGIRFYKGGNNTGTHVGLLYSNTGALLASAVFSSETDSGWQTVTFPAAVALQANTTYVAAYWSSSGFAYTAGFFASQGVNEGQVQLLQSGVDGNNGVYAYGASPQFPASSFSNANYWVDVTFTAAATTSGGIGPGVSVKGDFDRNGVSDLVWQNVASTQVTVNYYGGTNGTQLLNWSYLDSTGHPGWTVRTVADFNGDHIPDLVLQNETTRQVVVWYMGGAGGSVFQNFAFLDAAGHLGWHVVAAADFNGDGVPDLVLQNDTTRQVVVWYMGGAGGSVFQNFAFLDAGGHPGWTVESAADFNGDGVPDLVLQNDATRQVVVWYMGGPGGATLGSFAFLDAAGHAGWHVLGTGDFNADGVPDLILENDTTNTVVVWYMGGTGGATMQSFFVENGGAPGWLIVNH